MMTPTERVIPVADLDEQPSLFAAPPPTNPVDRLRALFDQLSPDDQWAFLDGIRRDYLNRQLTAPEGSCGIRIPPYVTRHMRPTRKRDQHSKGQNP